VTPDAGAQHGVPEPATLFRTMLQPKWIGALVFALAIAAAFAWLGQWQLARAIDSGTVVQRPTETVVPLRKAATPNGPLRTASVGQLVSFEGSFVPGDYALVADRMNHGRTGWWVVGHFTLSDKDAAGKSVELAVARGWAPDKAAANAAIARLAAAPAAHQESLTGRIIPTESPTAPPPGADPNLMTEMSTAALFNLWHGVNDSDVYSGYVVEHGTPPAGLDLIYSPPPIVEATVDWLNVFYAAEWAIFAGFAVFLWYRVVRDAWERAIEDAAAAADSDAAADSGSSGVENVVSHENVD
jgi:cytochrome oxidase assembly protein ShyY1